MTVRSPMRPCQLADAGDATGGDRPGRHDESSVVWAHSDSHRMSSSSTPSASATTAPPRRTPPCPRGHLMQSGVVDRLTEADRALGVRRVVEGGVSGLADRDLVDAAADDRRHDGHQLGEPGAHAGAEHGEPPGSHAWTMRSRPAPRLPPVMKAAVVTTLTPAEGCGRARRLDATSGCRRRSPASARAARRRHWWRPRPPARRRRARRRHGRPFCDHA